MTESEIKKEKSGLKSNMKYYKNLFLFWMLLIFGFGIIGISTYEFITDRSLLQFLPLPTIWVRHISLTIGSWALDVILGAVWLLLAYYVNPYRKEKGLFAKEIKKLKEDIEKESNNADLYGELAETYLYSGHYSEAMEACRQTIKLDPDNEDAYYWMGNVFIELNRYTEAINAFDRVLKLEPNFAYAHYYRGVAFTELNRYPEAIDAFNRMIKLD